MTGAPLVSPGAQLGTSTLGRGTFQFTSETLSLSTSIILVESPNEAPSVCNCETGLLKRSLDSLVSVRSAPIRKTRCFEVLVNRARPAGTRLAASCLLTGGMGDEIPTS